MVEQTSRLKIELTASAAVAPRAVNSLALQAFYEDRGGDTTPLLTRLGAPASAPATRGQGKPCLGVRPGPRPGQALLEAPSLDPGRDHPTSLSSPFLILGASPPPFSRPQPLPYLFPPLSTILPVSSLRFNLNPRTHGMPPCRCFSEAFPWHLPTSFTVFLPSLCPPQLPQLPRWLQFRMPQTLRAPGMGAHLHDYPDPPSRLPRPTLTSLPG